MVWNLGRTLRRQLTCPECGDVVADVAYRPLLGSLVITALAGYQIMPSRLSDLRQLTAQQLAEAGNTDIRLRERLAFIDANWQEMIYEIPCGRGHSTLCTAPQIATAVRRSAGRWVDLGRAR
ncbi:MAG: hypothetical protein ACRDPH_07225 [Marmoricola sp.]